MAGSIHRKDSKTARINGFTNKIRDDIRYSSLAKSRINEKARERFLRKPYGKVGDNIGKSRKEKSGAEG